MSLPNAFRSAKGQRPAARQLELLRAYVNAGAAQMSAGEVGRLVGMADNQARRSLTALEQRGLVVLLAHGGPARVTDEGLRVAKEGRAA